jgi:hypothetical protein
MDMMMMMMMKQTIMIISRRILGAMEEILLIVMIIIIIVTIRVKSLLIAILSIRIVASLYYPAVASYISYNLS